MSASKLPNEQFSEFLALGHDALRHDHHAKAAAYLGQAMLAGDGVVQLVGQEPVALGGYYDHRLSVATEAVEYAMPRNLSTINAQRVRVERLLLGIKDSGKLDDAFTADESRQGFNVSVRYPLGGVQRATLVWNTRNSKVDAWKITSSTKNWEDYGRSTANLRSLAAVMDWAVTEGTMIPSELHGRRTARDRMQTANLIGYNLFIGWMERAGRSK